MQLDGGETSAPSFLAASEEESYVFLLTVRDLAGNEDTDTVGVTVRKFVSVPATTDDTDIVPAKEIPVWMRWLVDPLNLLLLLFTSRLHRYDQLQALGLVVFGAGSLLNTMLLIMTPQMSFLLVEIAYVVLVVIKVGLESKKKPSFGLVRDAVLTRHLH